MSDQKHNLFMIKTPLAKNFPNLVGCKKEGFIMKVVNFSQFFKK